MARQQRHARHAGAGHAALRAERHARATAHGHHHHGHTNATTTSTTATPTTTTTAAAHKPPPAGGDPTWTGGGGNVNWSTPGNWTPGAPTSSQTTDLVFAGTTNIGTSGTPLNNNFTAPMVLNSIAFSSGGGAFFLGGNSIQLDGTAANANTITQNSSSAESIANVITASGMSTNGTNTITLTGNGTGVVTLSGTILVGMGQRDYAITKTGTSTFVLSGANTYTGATTISAGTLSANKIVVSSGNSSLGNAGSAVILGDATNQGTLSYTGGTATYTRGFTINAGGGQLTNAGGGTLTVSTGGISAGGLFTVGGASGNNITISSSSVISGAGGLTKTGADTLTLSGANTYAGDTTISAGILRNGTNDVIPDGAGKGNVIVSSGATWELRGFNETINGLSGSGTINGNNSADNTTSTLTVGNNNATSIFSGIITDSASNNARIAALTKIGTGTQTLSGANNYAGATSVQNGILSVSSLNNVNVGGSSNLGAPDTVAHGTIAMGSTTTTGQLTYTGTGETTDRVINLAGTTGGAILDQSGTGTLTFSSNFTATGAGSKTLTLQGSTAGTGVISGAIVDNSGTNKTSLTKAGTGTWTLSGANTYSGTTTINAGTLKLDNAGSTTARLANTSGITVNSGGTLLLASSSGSSTDRINNSATVNLASGGSPGTGGIFNTGGLSEGTAPTGGVGTGAVGLGALTLNSNSTIDFNAPGSSSTAGGSALVFQSLPSFVSGTALTIAHWTGNPNQDGSDRLLFVTDPGLTLANLANVQFTNDAGGLFALGAREITFNGMFEIVPVPEPSTWVAGALALTSLVACRAGVIRRRVGQRRRISRLVRRR